MNYGKLKVGTVLECTNSKSIAYKKGNTYKVVEKLVDQTKAKGLIGDDGLFDPFSLLISAFKPVDATQQAVHNLKVVK